MRRASPTRASSPSWRPRRAPTCSASSPAASARASTSSASTPRSNRRFAKRRAPELVEGARSLAGFASRLRDRGRAAAVASATAVARTGQKKTPASFKAGSKDQGGSQSRAAFSFWRRALSRTLVDGRQRLLWQPWEPAPSKQSLFLPGAGSRGCRGNRCRPPAIALRATLGRRGDRAEQAVALAVGAGGEKERVGARGAAAAQRQGPQAVDRQRLAVAAVELVDEVPALVEGVDPAVAEIADQDVAAEAAEGEGGARHGPGRIEVPVAGEAPQQVAVGVEHIDEAAARAGDVVVLLRVLLGIGHEEIAVEVLDAERREARGDHRIGEAAVGRGAGEGAAGGVGAVDLDRAGAEIGREQEHAMHIDAGGEALVDGAVGGVGDGRIVDGDDRVAGRGEAAGPGGDRAVLGGEDEAGRQRRSGDA